MEEILSSNEPYKNAVFFRKTERGLARFPTRIEMITVQNNGERGKVLVIQKDDLRMSFPLGPAECTHLAQILTE